MCEPILKLTGVTKSFSKGRLSLIVNDLEIRKGEFLAIVGPSGGGKTTLINILAGFIKPDSGEALKNGLPLPPPGPDRLPVFQDHALFPWYSVRENVAYGIRNQGVSKKEIALLAREALRTVNLEDAADLYPAQLSGGMRQRVALARTLALKPEILLLDEPFAALDEGNRERLYKELEKIRSIQQPTIVMVTHNLDEAVNSADRIAVLMPPPTGLEEVLNLPPRKGRLSNPETEIIRKKLARAMSP